MTHHAQPDARRPLARRLAPLLMLALAGHASAQSIFVERHTGSGWEALPALAGGGSGLPNGSDITLELAGTDIVRIYSNDPATADIGLITVHAPEAATPTVLVARNAGPGLNESQPIGTIAARSLAGLIATANTKVQINVGTITGPGVEAGRIARLDVAGDLDAPVIHWGTEGATQPGIGAIIVGGSISERAPITAVHGRIDRLQIAGDVLANIAAQNGGFDVISIGGSVGDQDHAPTIYAYSGSEPHAITTLIVGGTLGSAGNLARVLTAGPIVRIEADAIHADIDALLDPTDPGFIGGVITRNGGLTGSLMARSLTSFGGWSEAPCVIDLAGDLDGLIFIENVVRNERAGGPEIDIAGGVSAGSLIVVNSLYRNQPSLPAPEIRVAADAGLAGQIIVGSTNPASFEGDATITLGSASPLRIRPASRHYTELSSELGGGAVGIVSFNFHPLECFPQHNETLTLEAGSELTGAVVRLYGPAFGELPGFVVEHRASEADIWTDRSADFAAIAASTEADASRELRIEAVGGASFTPGEWRIRPVEGSIRCALAATTPAIRFDSEYEDDTYRFIVASECDQPGTGGRATDAGNDLRTGDEGDYITPPDPGVNPCP